MSGLYVHIPFCERKCIYCNFYSIETFEGKERYLRAVDREITMRADEIRARGVAVGEFDTVFLGGGTPSLLSPEEIGTIMAALGREFTIAEGAEVTMECNPGTLDEGWLAGYRDLGVNRISFGVQSFDDEELRFLSRIHTAEQASQSIELARGYFENVSLDLIFALPKQTRERWRSNLQRGVELGTGHISAYSLIFEEGTPLHAMRRAGAVRPIADDLEADMYEETMETLSAYGFEQYEVSNYARPGRECRHNLGYWERQSYLAFGPSAHGFLREGSPLRWANVSNLSAWLEGIENNRLPVASSEEITPSLAIEELIYLGLRSRGVSLEEFQHFAGESLQEAAPTTVAALCADGYARLADGRLSLTRKGYPFADRFAVELIQQVEREEIADIQR